MFLKTMSADCTYPRATTEGKFKFLVYENKIFLFFSSQVLKVKSEVGIQLKSLSCSCYPALLGRYTPDAKL